VIFQPDVETRSWDEQLALDDASFREQVAYGLERSAFYGEKLSTARDRVRRGTSSASAISRDSRSPTSTRSRRPQRRRTRSARTCASSVPRSRASTRRAHDRRAELHPADGRRRRQLGDRLGAQLLGLGCPARTADRLDLQRRPFVAGAALDASSASASRTSRSGPATPSACCSRRVLRPRPSCSPVVRRLSSASSPRSEASISPGPASSNVLVAASRWRRPAFRAPRGGLGRTCHRGHGHRGHRRLAVGGVRGAGRDAPRCASFVHAELVDPGTGEDVRFRTARTGELGALASPPPRRAASAVPQPRPRPRSGRRLPLRAHGPSRPLHRTHPTTCSSCAASRFPTAVREVVRGVRPGAVERPRPREAPRRPGCNRIRPCRSRWSSRRESRPAPGLADEIRERPARRAGRHDRSSSSSHSGAHRAERVQVEAGRSIGKLRPQGVHHITINGADRQTAIDFWEGVLGMPFVFEQPNLDNEGESHL